MMPSHLAKIEKYIRMIKRSIMVLVYRMTVE